MTFDRYLVGETLRPFIALLALLTGVFMAYSLTRFLDAANDGLLSARVVLVLTAFKALIALEVLVPVALYVALIVALGRLYSDWEIVALRAAGSSELRTAVPVLLVAAVVAGAVAVLSLWIRPWAYERLYALEAEGEAGAGVEELRAGRFHVPDDDGRTVFLAERDRGGALRGLFVHALDDAGGLEVITARSGRMQEGGAAAVRHLALVDARVLRRSRSGTTVVGEFGRLTLALDAVAVAAPGYRAKSASSAALARSSAPRDRAELQWRQSTAVSTLLLALAAVPLARTRPRSGRYARVFAAIVLYVVYFNVIGIARSEVEQAVLGSLWWAPGALAAALVTGIVLLRRGGP